MDKRKIVIALLGLGVVGGLAYFLTRRKPKIGAKMKEVKLDGEHIYPSSKKGSGCSRC